MENKDKKDKIETIATFLPLSKRLDLDQFMVRFPHPFLICEGGIEDAGGSSRFGTVIFFHAQPAQEGTESVDQQRKRVFRLVKKENSPVAQMITVGRAGNNDIRILDPLVSKFHAYFQRQDNGEYILCDAGSTNGTMVNDEQLGPREKRTVQQGDRLSFGGEELFNYHTNQGFFEFLSKLV